MSWFKMIKERRNGKVPQEPPSTLLPEPVVIRGYKVIVKYELGSPEDQEMRRRQLARVVLGHIMKT